MSDLDDGADGGVPTDDHGDDGVVSSFTFDGTTVLYDATDTERWLQSDASVPLAERATAAVATVGPRLFYIVTSVW
jgi:hypothetical protein